MLNVSVEVDVVPINSQPSAVFFAVVTSSLVFSSVPEVFQYAVFSGLPLVLEHRRLPVMSSVR